MSIDTRVFRKGYYEVFATIAVAALAVGFAFAAYRQHGVIDVSVGGLMGGLFLYGLWLVGWHSAVRVADQYVVVDNALLRYVIPLRAVSSVDVETGIRIRVMDGKELRPIVFGGSVIGNMLGYRFTKKVAAEISAEIAERARVVVASSSPARDCCHKAICVPWIPLGVFVGGMELVSFVAYSLR